MIKRNCQHCRKVIGDDDSSCFHYGYVICKACKTKVEELYQVPTQVPSVANDNVETEIPIVELESKQNGDTKYQAPVYAAEGQYAGLSLKWPIDLGVRVNATGERKSKTS